MNTQQLESFIQVAENLNFARAAEALNVTQSAVSRQIHSLEEELGTKLFIRSTRTVSLTPAGISFLDDAKEVLAKLRMAQMKIEKNSNTKLDFLSIGCGNELYLPFISDLLTMYHKKYPEIHPFLRFLPSRSILNSFFNGAMDILFGFYDDVPSRSGILYQEIIKLPVCCVVPFDHPYAGKESVTARELMTENIILCNSTEIPAQVAVAQQRVARQFSPEAFNYCENVLAALALVKAGYGISILPRSLNSSFGFSFLPLSPSEEISFGLFYKNSSDNHIVQSFLSIVSEYEPDLPQKSL